MRRTNGLLFVVAFAGSSYLAWRNRFVIQRRLESRGVRTPLLRGSAGEVARSLAAKTRGRLERRGILSGRLMSRRMG